jgi:hypothetical protein
LAGRYPNLLLIVYFLAGSTNLAVSTLAASGAAIGSAFLETFFSVLLTFSTAGAASFFHFRGSGWSGSSRFGLCFIFISGTLAASALTVAAAAAGAPVTASRFDISGMSDTKGGGESEDDQLFGHLKLLEG